MDKINYIKENINNCNIEHGIVIEFLVKNNLDFIKNMNGIYFTINKTPNEFIYKLYNIIHNYIQNVNVIMDEMKDYEELITDNINIINTKVDLKKNKYKD